MLMLITWNAQLIYQQLRKDVGSSLSLIKVVCLDKQWPLFVCAFYLIAFGQAPFMYLCYNYGRLSVWMFLLWYFWNILINLKTFPLAPCASHVLARLLHHFQCSEWWTVTSREHWETKHILIYWFWCINNIENSLDPFVLILPLLFPHKSFEINGAKRWFHLGQYITIICSTKI